MTIDWNKLWKDFDKWFFDKNRMCSQCGRHRDPPEWEDQQKKIEKLVEKQLNNLT